MYSLRKQVFAWVVVSITMSFHAVAQTTLYVNGSCGDDSWSGTSNVCASPDGPKQTIQAGIDAASTGDTIIVANGIYTGTGNRDMDDGGRDLALRSESGDPSLCIIDCEGSKSAHHRAFILRGETIIEGIGIHGGYADRGGAIEARGASLTLTDCQLSENTARFGGAIWFESGSMTAERCSFVDNLADEDSEIWALGGAMWIGGGGGRIESCTFSNNETYADDGAGGALYIESGEHAVINCVFEDNVAVGFCGAQGGAIASSGSASVVGCEFTGNMTLSGGCGGGDNADGGALFGSFSIIESCAFVGNLASSINSSGGGAINATGPVRDCVFKNNEVRTDNPGQNSGGAAYGGGPFTDCTFIGNSAASGAAAMSGRAGSSFFTNCLFIQNWARYEYGALSIQSGSRIINCTFVRNRGGAVLGYFGNAIVSNSIFLGNTGTFYGNEPLWSVTLAHSCIDFSYPGIGVINSDPRFVDPASDFHVLPGSPAIDAADNTALPVGVTTDLDGNPRFVDDPNMPNTGVPGNGYAEIVDMGAYEFQACYADCDQSTGVGVIDIFDFLCFQNSFVNSEPYACDCDTSTGVGVCDIFDFLCFQNAFIGRCP